MDELELLQGGQTLDNEHVVSKYFNDKTEVIARIVAADENEDPFLVSYFGRRYRIIHPDRFRLQGTNPASNKNPRKK